MSENIAEENQVKTSSEESTQKVDSNQEYDVNNSQDVSKRKSNEEGSIRSNVPGESVIGNQEPNEVLNKSQQEKPEEQIESSLILNVRKVENLDAAKEEDAGGDNSGGDENDDKIEQDKKSEESAKILKAQESNQELGEDPLMVTREVVEKYPSMGEQLKDPGVQKILMSEEDSLKHLITERYMDGRI